MNLKSINKMNVLLKCVPLFILLVLSTNHIHAMYPKVSLEEVAQTADMIFIGTAVSQDTYFNEQRTAIFTNVFFDDISVVYCKPNAQQESSSIITLTHAGGCVDDLCMVVSDSPSFINGQRYLVFMSDDGKRYFNPIIGGGQGLFKVVNDTHTGTSFALSSGDKVFLKDENQEIILSNSRVEDIQNGFPVYKKKQLDSPAQPPKAASGKGRAYSPSYHSEKSHRNNKESDLQAVTLSEFCSYVKDVALKVKLERKVLKRGGRGMFLKKDGTTVDLGKSRTNIPEDKFFVPPFQDAVSYPSPLSEPHKNMAAPDFPQGGQLGWCGYHLLPLVMEMVPKTFWTYDDTNRALWIWNQFMDIYRIRQSDGTFGYRNNQNEFGGFLDDETLFRIYGAHWNGLMGYAFRVQKTRKNPCGLFLESDVLLNASYNWTDNEEAALGNSDYILLLPMLMHELAHTWGLQMGIYTETYDYDKLTVVHSYYSHIVENGLGIHASDAYLIRRCYLKQKDIINITDVGIESYYANNGLHPSTSNALSYKPGDAITLSNITAENMSFNEVTDVRVRFFLSSNRIISDKDYLFSSYSYWNTFRGEARSVFNKELTIPDNIPPGLYYIGMIISINGYEEDDFPYNNATSFSTPITIEAADGGEDKNGDDNGDDESNGDSDSPKCFIATATFASPYHPHVTTLRAFRDKYLLPSQLGRELVELYYRYSPFAANFIKDHEILKSAVRTGLIPLVVFCNALLENQ